MQCKHEFEEFVNNLGWNYPTGSIRTYLPFVFWVVLYGVPHGFHPLYLSGFTHAAVGGVLQSGWNHWGRGTWSDAKHEQYLHDPCPLISLLWYLFSVCHDVKIVNKTFKLHLILLYIRFNLVQGYKGLGDITYMFLILIVILFA